VLEFFLFSLLIARFDCGCSCGIRYGMMLKRKGGFGADIPKRCLFEFDLLEWFLNMFGVDGCFWNLGEAVPKELFSCLVFLESSDV
jgi:hypothetical protein